MKKCLTSLVTRKMQIKASGIPPLVITIIIIVVVVVPGEKLNLKRLKKPNVGEDVEQAQLSICW